MKKLLMLGLVVTALMSTGCATIMHGDKQNVSIVSGKPEATIKVLDNSGNVVTEGKGKVDVLLKRGNGMFKGCNYKIVAESGSDKQEILLESGVNGAYVVGNFFLGGFIGWVIVDPVSGAMWTIKTPDGLPAKEIKIMTVDKVPESVMEKAEKVEEKK